VATSKAFCSSCCPGKSSVGSLFGWQGADGYRRFRVAYVETAKGSGTTAVQSQVIYNRRNIIPLQWNAIQAGEKTKLTAIATGGAKLQIHLRDGAGKTLYDSGLLGNGESVRFAWPAGTWAAYIFAFSGVGAGSTGRGELVRAPVSVWQPFLLLRN
jgi:hypothetical protein